MSETVEKCTKELIRAIRESEECRKFEMYREQLAQYPDLWQKAQDFRKKAFVIQSSNEPVDMLHEMSLLFRERIEIRKTKLIADYLSAELEICRMLQRVSLEVMGATDLNLESLQDVMGI